MPDLHPLLAVRPRTPESRTLVIVVTGDKGLCGGFNTNVIKAAATFVLDSGERCELGLVGRKGRDYFTRRGFAVAFEQVQSVPDAEISGRAGFGGSGGRRIRQR